MHIKNIIGNYEVFFSDLLHRLKAINIDITGPEFKQKYHNVLTGVKEHGPHCQPAFVTFDNDKTVKFYDHTLKDIVLLQGWTIERIKTNADINI